MDENLRVWDVAHDVLPYMTPHTNTVNSNRNTCDEPAHKRRRADAHAQPKQVTSSVSDELPSSWMGARRSNTLTQSNKGTNNDDNDVIVHSNTQLLPHLSEEARVLTHCWGVNGAHSGAIYALAVSPHTRYLATGGKDRLVHVWNVRAGGRVYKEASLTGHRRGIAALTFSPTDRVLASAGSDGAVRLWSLVSLNCVRTLQADRAAILQLAFFNAGTQLVTGNAEGVLRVWAVATAESVWSAELHKDKIWALAVMEAEGNDNKKSSSSSTGNRDGVRAKASESTRSGLGESSSEGDATKGANEEDEKEEEAGEGVNEVDDGAPNQTSEPATTLFLTGSADGVLIATEDFTAEAATRAREDRRELVEKEQELANALRLGRYADAFSLALRLSHPRHLRQVMASWSAKDGAGCAQALRDTLLPRLDADSLRRLLQYTREWMTNSRHCAVASLVTRAFLRSYHLIDIAAMPEMTSLVAPLLAYSQKHSQRQHQLLRRTYYLDYLTRTLSPNMLSSLPPFVKPMNPTTQTE